MCAALVVIIKPAIAGLVLKQLKRGMKGIVKMIKLKPCPFCGEDEKIKIMKTAGKAPVYFVYCGNCVAVSGSSFSEADVVIYWNTRAYEDKNVN